MKPIEGYVVNDMAINALVARVNALTRRVKALEDDGEYFDELREKVDLFIRAVEDGEKLEVKDD